MGVESFDYWSIEHFLMGSLSQSLLQKAGISTPVNLILTNFIHLAIELFEKDIKYGKIAESYENHMTDIILFLSGWCLAYIINMSQYIPEDAVQMLWAMVFFVIIKEILIEIYIDLHQEINNVFIFIMICLGTLVIAKRFWK
jgi:hypothetical protein